MKIERNSSWWKAQDKGKRRYPGSKGKKVLHAIFNGIEYDYVNSRKFVYIPEYYELIKSTQSLKSLVEHRNSGKDIVVFDFDGPRNENGENTFREVTNEMLMEEVDYTKYPFGHGYVVAAAICGFKMEF